MQFSQFAHHLEVLSHTTKRLEITHHLAELLSALAQEEIKPSCYLLQGRLTPLYESLEFQLSIKMILRALARIKSSSQAQGASSASINMFGESDDSQALQLVENLYKKIGDLGEVTQQSVDDFHELSRACLSSDGSSRGSQSTSANIQTNRQIDELTQQAPQEFFSQSLRHDQLSVLDVFQQLTAIAQDGGDGSQDRKLVALVELLKSLDGLSGKYVVRIILGRLRLGFSDMTMLDALSWAMTGGKSEHDALEDAYQKRSDIGWLAATYLQEKDAALRIALLQKTEVSVGVPVMSALCQRLNSTTEMIEKMSHVYAEPKYDGLRVQIHVRKKFERAADFPTKSSNLLSSNNDWTVRTFTRNLEETTHMFPELVAAVSELDCDSCILDAEAIGYDRETDEFLPFQQTITRKRKHDVAEKSLEVPLIFFVFDILSLDGKSLISLPLQERKLILKKVIGKTSAQIIRQTTQIETSDAQELKTFHEKCLAEGLEGMVVKSRDGAYQSGRKGWSWVKIKEEEGQSGKLTDTVDGVVMGYYAGRGKRVKFGVGAFLIGVLTDDGRVVTLAKIGTGLTDEQFHELKSRCDALRTASQPVTYSIHKMLVPDSYILPGLVVEVAADEITNSPVHTAGVALRFPRLVKFRDDKSWQDATTVKELGEIRIK